MQELPRPVPRGDRDTTPFWDAQAEHRLSFQKCSKCSQIRYPIGPMCPACHSLDFEWVESTGKGTIYSYTVVHHQTHPAFKVPYTVALVEMEEGPRVVAELRGDGAASPEIGKAVRVEWVDHPKQPLPVFVLDEERS